MGSTAELQKPPYVSFRTFYNFLDMLKEYGVPSRIDRHMLRKVSGATQSQLINALKYLDLIDADNNRTPLLQELAISPSDERRRIVGELLRQSYDFVFGAIDVENAGYQEFREVFNEQGVRGETGRKAEMFFIKGAEFAQIKLSTYIADSRPNMSRKRDVKRSSKSSASLESEQVSNQNNSIQPVKNDEPTQNAALYSDYPLLAKLLTELPLDGSWTSEERERWLTAHTSVLDLLIDIVD